MGGKGVSTPHFSACGSIVRYVILISPQVQQCFETPALRTQERENRFTEGRQTTRPCTACGGNRGTLIFLHIPFNPTHHPHHAIYRRGTTWPEALARSSCLRSTACAASGTRTAASTTATSTTAAAVAASRPVRSTSSLCLPPSSAPTASTAARHPPWTSSGVSVETSRNICSKACLLACLPGWPVCLLAWLADASCKYMYGTETPSVNYRRKIVRLVASCS